MRVLDARGRGGRLKGRTLQADRSALHYERRYCSDTLASTGAAAMYPAEVLALFPPFPRNNRVFVAMSFDDRFQLRFDEVLRPAIEGIEYLGQKLVAHRVDLTIKSD